MKRLLCVAVVLVVSACVPPAFAWPGCEVDDVRAEVAGSTVTIVHEDAAYNCCVDGFDYTVEVVGEEILVVETEILTEPCACLCCFNLSVEIADLPPGEYVLVFTWLDSDSGQWVTWSDTVVVSDVGQGGAAFVADSANSGCIDQNPAPEPEIEANLWGSVKARYR